MLQHIFPAGRKEIPVFQLCPHNCFPRNSVSSSAFYNCSPSNYWNCIFYNTESFHNNTIFSDLFISLNTLIIFNSLYLTLVHIFIILICHLEHWLPFSLITSWTTSFGPYNLICFDLILQVILILLKNLENTTVLCGAD